MGKLDGEFKGDLDKNLRWTLRGTLMGNSRGTLMGNFDWNLGGTLMGNSMGTLMRKPSNCHLHPFFALNVTVRFVDFC